MKHATRTNKLARRSLPALAAVGGSLAALPAAAIQLGDITVQSRLGQPLRASIAFALAPNEQVSDYCITMRPGASLSGLPNVGNATISVANGVILLSGSTPLREPMVSAHVVINCPYAANLSREYMLFIDPEEPAYEPVTVTQQSSAEAAPIAVSPASVAAPVARVQAPAPATAQRTPTRRAAAPVVKDIAAATTYTVKSGDTVSGIAQRIENRSVGLWAAVDAIFEANPDAFINGDVNLIKLGSQLTIPSFGNGAAVVADAAPAVSSNNAEPVMPVTEVVPAPDTQVAAEELSVTTDDLQPGGIESTDNPFVETQADASAAETVVIPDTQLEGPTTTSTSPNVATAVITNNAASSESATPSWVLWLAGSGVALILGLLMFGRRLRRNPEPEDFVTPLAVPGERRRQTDAVISVEETSAHDFGLADDTASVAALEDTQSLADDSPTEENIALDANLVVSSDLEDTQEAIAPPKYGFSEAPEVDIELPFEPVESISDKTDILPPLRTDEFTILDSEVFIDDDADISSIIDIDLQETAEVKTVREEDSNVVQMISPDDTMQTDSYTINDEADIRALEQDYEDEFTATQALNKEIERAAAEIAENMERGDEDGDETSALPMASVTELDITAQMPAQNDADSSVEDTGITQALNLDEVVADDATVEMPAKTKKS